MNNTKKLWLISISTIGTVISLEILIIVNKWLKSSLNNQT